MSVVDAHQGQASKGFGDAIKAVYEDDWEEAESVHMAVEVCYHHHTTLAHHGLCGRHITRYITM